jgi:hypothetical protein
MLSKYLAVVSLVERLHRQFLDLVKSELDGLRIDDINNVQGMLLFNIGEARMAVGEVMLRGCYLGSNVSYSIKRLVENGYLAQERAALDPCTVDPKRDANCGTDWIKYIATTWRCWVRRQSPARISKRRMLPCTCSSTSGPAQATW